MSSDEQARLLDTSGAFEVELLDRIVSGFYSTGQSSLGNTLVAFQSNTETYVRAPEILERSKLPQAHTMAASMLESVVRYRWESLTVARQLELKGFVASWISANCATANPALLNKMDLVLVNMVKHEWWPDFIPSLVAGWSNQGDALATNAMRVLLLLSEEVFDYGADSLTQADKHRVQTAFSQQFTQVFGLIQQVLTGASNSTVSPVMLGVTLEALERFLRWIPSSFIFESDLIDTLVVHILPMHSFVNRVLLCLTEIVQFDISVFPAPTQVLYSTKISQMYGYSIQHVLQNIMTPEKDLSCVFSSDDEYFKLFLRTFLGFLSSCFGSHFQLLKRDPTVGEPLLQGMKLLISICKSDDTEVFKVAMDCWAGIVTVLKSEVDVQSQSSGGFQPQMVSPLPQALALVLSELKWIMVSRMAKPEEVLITTNEAGDSVRATMQDTDELELYSTMRNTLIKLTQIDPEDTNSTINRKLQRQMTGQEYSPESLSALCWAVGSISGALSAEKEKMFVVNVIRDLLALCDDRRGKSSKAIIASNIMFVVGQYPRFLKDNWRFMKAVLNKLFEFMHETFPGVQEMACDTFYKIVLKCRNKLIHVQEGDSRPFIADILESVTPHAVQSLPQDVVGTFYEAVGYVLAGESNSANQQAYLNALLSSPNSQWVGFVHLGSNNISGLFELNTMRQVHGVLVIYTRVASTVGDGFIVQLSRVFGELMQMYLVYSGFIREQVVTHGNSRTGSAPVLLARKIKYYIIRLLDIFVGNSGGKQKQVVMNQFMEGIFSTIIADYANSIPELRETGVLSMLSTFFDKLAGSMIPVVPVIMTQVFNPTTNMITANLVDYPEHRIAFFFMLKSMVTKIFPAVSSLPTEQFKTFYECIAWAIRHLESSAAEIGLETVCIFFQYYGIAKPF